jgi:hypothetical protein
MKNPSPKKHAAKKPAASAAPVHVKSADRHLKPNVLGIFSPEPVRAVAGETFDLMLRANGRVDFWKAAGLPEGLSINETNGNISGTAALPGSSKVTVMANAFKGPGHPDGGVTATLEFIIDVD